MGDGMSKKTALIVSVVAVAIFIGAVVSVSYAYFIKGISFDPTNNTRVTTADMVSPEFKDGDVVNVTDLLPGDSFTKSFAVINNGKETFKFKIVLNNVSNTFTRKQDVIYELYEVGSSGTKTLIKSAQWPDTTSVLSKSDTSLTVDAKAKKDYELKVTYKEEDVNQLDDQGKTISGKIFIEEVADATK